MSWFFFSFADNFEYHFKITNDMTQLKANKGQDLFPSLVTDFFNSDKFFGPGRWFEKALDDFMPAVNIKESEKQFTIELAAPGFEKNDFKIHVEGDMLSVRAEKKQEKDEKEERYTRREYSYNAFSRSFTLPQNANGEHVEARYEKGILELTIAKKTPGPVSGRKEIPIS